MIRSFLMLSAIVVISSIYAWIVNSFPVEIVYTIKGIHFDLSTPNIATYHIPLAVFDMIAIWLLRRNHVEYLTNPLTVMLAISVINQTMGAFAFIAYNDYVLGGYEFGRIALLALELMAFTFYGLYTVCSRPDNMDARFDWDGLRIVENDQCH